MPAAIYIIFKYLHNRETGTSLVQSIEEIEEEEEEEEGEEEENMLLTLSKLGHEI
jgi:hypothetical protein